MAALARAISQVTGSQVDVDSLRGILVFCILGLFLSAIAIKAYGLDFSVGLF